MRKTGILGLLVAVVIFIHSPQVAASASRLAAVRSPFDTWERIRTPSPGPAAAIGGYSAGCLAGAEQLEPLGMGFVTMRPGRKRFYGHPDLVQYVRALGEKLKKQNLPLMLVGDLSPPRGGPMRTGHVSHQSGLDVDIWLMMSKKTPTLAERESWGAPSYVIDRKKLKSNWSDQQVKLVATAADFEQVNRIFVSPAIKKYFCEHFPTAQWLHKIRAWWSHHDHLHVRLNCSKDSPNCEPQDPLDPSVTHCGPDLDWWFSKEADDEWAEMVRNPTPRQFPNLPIACEELAKDSSPTLNKN